MSEAILMAEEYEQGYDDSEVIENAWRFTPHTYAAVASGGKWKPYRWLSYIGDIIADTVARGGGRLIVNCPPRSGKSEFISHWVPAWYEDALPWMRTLLVSYEQALSTDWGRKVRNEFEHNRHTRTKLRQDSTSASRWHTPEGGGMECAGVGGPITGKGGNLIIVDDPHKNWAEANSPLQQERLWEWFQSTLYTRLEPGGTIIILMQRWCDDDLTGRLMREHEDAWNSVVLPALAGQNDPMGRQYGEPLCPERYDRAALLDIKRSVGAVVWEALYQQNPSNVGRGRAYEAFTDAHVSDDIEFNPRLPLDLSFDFNIDPGMHVVIGQHDERADWYRALAEVHGPRMNLNQAMDAIEAWVAKQGGVREIQVFGDASGHSESKQTSQSDYDIIAQRLQRTGVPFRIRVPKSAPAIRDSLNAMAEALNDVDGREHYAVHPRCDGLIKDFRNVKRSADGLIVKTNKTLTHFSDAERYRIAYLRPIGYVRGQTTGGRIIY